MTTRACLRAWLVAAALLVLAATASRAQKLAGYKSGAEAAAAALQLSRLVGWAAHPAPYQQGPPLAAHIACASGCKAAPRQETKRQPLNRPGWAKRTRIHPTMQLHSLLAEHCSAEGRLPTVGSPDGQAASRHHGAQTAGAQGML